MLMKDPSSKVFKLLNSENFIYELRTDPELLEDFYECVLQRKVSYKDFKFNTESPFFSSNDIDFIDKVYNYISTINEKLANELIMNIDESLLMTWVYNTDILSSLPSTQVYFYRRLGKQVVPLICVFTTQPFIKEVIVNKDQETYELLMKRRDVVNKFDQDLLNIAFNQTWTSKIHRASNNLTLSGKLGVVLAFVLVVLILIDLVI